MTTFESVMLAVCFGAVVGGFFGNAICLIKYSIEDRRRKKQTKEPKSDEDAKQDEE